MVALAVGDLGYTSQSGFTLYFVQMIILFLCSAFMTYANLLKLNNQSERATPHMGIHEKSSRFSERSPNCWQMLINTGRQLMLHTLNQIAEARWVLHMLIGKGLKLDPPEGHYSCCVLCVGFCEEWPPHKCKDNKTNVTIFLLNLVHQYASTLKRWLLVL